jgi:putative MATE family efflux protein
MIALIAEPLLGLVDTALVGHLGSTQLAAMAIVTTFLSSVIWLFNFLISGTTANIAYLNGKGDEEGKRQFYSQSVFLALIIAFLLVVIGYLFQKTVFLLMGASPEVAEVASLYYKIRLAGIPFVFMYFIGMGFLRGIKDMKTPMFISIAINILNAMLDYILIYGIPGLLKGFGLPGAAAATIFSQFLGAVAYLVIIARRYSVFPHPEQVKNLDMSLFKHLIKVNRHLFFRTFFLLLGFTFATAMASRMDKVILAAHQIGIQIWLFLSFALDSFGIAAQAIAGNFKGKGLPGLIHRYGKILIQYGLALGISFALILFILNVNIFRLFTTERAVIENLHRIFLFLILFQPMNGIIFLLDGLLIGVLDTRFLMIELFIASFIVFIPVSYLSLHFHWGITGLWWGLTGFLVVRFLMNSARFLSKSYI